MKTYLVSMDANGVPVMVSEITESSKEEVSNIAFEVGDLVSYQPNLENISNIADVDSLPVPGAVGRILEADNTRVGVEFLDGFSQGHNLIGTGKEGHCWYYYYPSQADSPRHGTKHDITYGQSTLQLKKVGWKVCG